MHINYAPDISKMYMKDKLKTKYATVSSKYKNGKNFNAFYKINNNSLQAKYLKYEIS